ncbi:MAG: glucosaminidase domain-containing protein [Gammaproteobacteria bacterium]
MTGTVSDPSVYTDVNGLAALKRGARAQDPAALREAARQFESLFAKMMLKSMREASSGDPVFGSDQQKFYQGMFDDQLAIDLTKGHGLGLADMLIQQLTKAGMIPADAAAAAAADVGAKASAGSKIGGAASAGGLGGSNGTAIANAERAARESLIAMLGAGLTSDSSSTGSSATTFDFLSEQAKSLGIAPPVAHTEPGSRLETSSPAARESAASGAASTPANINALGVAPSTATGAGTGTTRISTGTSSTATTRTLTPEEFVKSVWPGAQAAGQLLGIDPNNLVAQAALETGWGRSIPKDASGNSSFNLFGVKTGAQWAGSSVDVRTLEYEHGIPVPRTDKFRAYDSSNDSFNDYVALLRDNPRYAGALNTGSDTAAFASALQKGGYATDPAYAEKLKAIAQNVAAMKVGLKSEDARPITPTSTML